jgi:hypothetical protein
MMGDGVMEAVLAGGGTCDTVEMRHQMTSHPMLTVWCRPLRSTGLYMRRNRYDFLGARSR